MADSDRFTALNNLIQHVEYDSDSSEYTDDSYYEVSAQEQWEESLRQVNALVSLVLFPLIGKVLGRRTSHMIWRRVANWLYARGTLH